MHILVHSQNSTFNSILPSHQEGGFPQLRLGSEPFSIGQKIESMEINYIVGILTGSDYLDTGSKNDHRFLNALILWLFSFFSEKPKT